MSEESAPILRLRGVTKRFGDVVANDGIDLELRAGEVHCLLGENGAGKSTLIALLAGLQQPNAGRIEFDGVPTVLASPAAARVEGVGVVYQHSALVPTMSVLDNLMLGADGFRLERADARRRLAELSVSLGERIDADRPLGELGLGQQQQLEIAKAMWAEPRLLILDEPTSMLGEGGARDLLARLRAHAEGGAAVLLVTHKLDEALVAGDRVTVLRAGRVVDRLGAGELRESGAPRESVRAENGRRILRAMFGEQSRGDEDAAALDTSTRRLARADGDALRLEQVSTARGDGTTPIERIDLSVGTGEIVGIAGIDGHGQKHLAEVIAGQRALAGGRVLLGGEDLAGLAVRGRRRRGLRYVTDDRLREGIVGSLSVALNLVLGRVGERPLWRFGFADRKAIDREAGALIEQYGIRTPSAQARAGTLSGGNIQKILLARELAHGPRVVVFDKPGYGLDLKTVRLVRQTIRDFASGGGAALLISTDLDELLALSNRIGVLSHGRIVGWVPNDGPGARERIGALMSGGDAA